MIYTSDLEANILRDAKNAMNDAIMYECHERYMHVNNTLTKTLKGYLGKGPRHSSNKYLVKIAAMMQMFIDEEFELHALNFLGKAFHWQLSRGFFLDKNTVF